MTNPDRQARIDARKAADPSAEHGRDMPYEPAVISFKEKLEECEAYCAGNPAAEPWLEKARAQYALAVASHSSAPKVWNDVAKYCQFAYLA